MTTTADTPHPSTTHPVTGERADLLDALAKHRGLFRTAVQGMTDEQARTRSTISELTLGGLVKHVAQVEQNWARFIVEGPAESEVDWADVDWSNPPAEVAAYADGFRMLEGETLAGLLDAYDAVAAATDDLVATVDLDASHPLPSAPWFTPGARWSARRVVTHILAETAQHAGHADIIRETIDGQKSMG
ncbi:DinB family protein [Nocardioides halotolerans]|uniref:DinB family protein n=1 Tax=Nocardioides halotolerans TaxID=433660 RepID=UPI00041B3EDD|nr:DinB family protein [Nocardioides halotolerans]